MRVLRRNRHLLRDREHASPTYGGWTIEKPTQLSSTWTTTRPGTSGGTRRQTRYLDTTSTYCLSTTQQSIR